MALPHFDAFDLLFLMWAAFMVLACPYSKVEESFNMQAVHDMLEFDFGLRGLSEFDHFKFPGSVPRSFVGSIAVAFIVYPVHALLKILQVSKYYSQLSLRLAVAFMSWYCYLKFRNAVNIRFSKRCGEILALLLSCQFHLPFYMSRTLPNSFAMMGCYLAYAEWLLGNPKKCLVILALFMVVFRCDLLVLLAPMALTMLMSKEIPFWSTLLIGAVACCSALLLTVFVDSYYWSDKDCSRYKMCFQGWLWPEGEVLMFNTVENKSSDWGVSPFHYYFTSLIPKTLVFQLVFVVLAILGVHYPLYSMDLIPFPGHSNPKSDIYPCIASVTLSQAVSHTEATSNISSLCSSSSTTTFSSTSGGRVKNTVSSSLSSITEAPSKLNYGSSPMIGVFDNFNKKWGRSVDFKHAASDATLSSRISFFSLIRNSFNHGYRLTVGYYIAPMVAFVCLYSILPHKELRFIFPIFPALTMAAAVACDALLRPDSANLFILNLILSDSHEEDFNINSSSSSSSNGKNTNAISKKSDYNELMRSKYLSKKMFRVKMSNQSSFNLFLFEISSSFAIIGVILACLAYSLVAVYASSANYSGGDSMESLYQSALPQLIERAAKIDSLGTMSVPLSVLGQRDIFYNINVHIDVLPAERGVTRFLQQDYFDLRFTKSSSSVGKDSTKDSCQVKAFVSYIYDASVIQGYSSRFHEISNTLSRSSSPLHGNSACADRLLDTTYHVRVSFSKEENLKDFSKFDVLITEHANQGKIPGFDTVLEIVDGLDDNKKFEFSKARILKYLKVPYLKTRKVPMISILSKTHI